MKHKEADDFKLSLVVPLQPIIVFGRWIHRVKRGGDALKVSIDPALLLSPGGAGVDMIEIDEALTDLAEFDPRKAKVVDLRYFAGMTEDEKAEVLEVSRETVKRDWRPARLSGSYTTEQPNISTSR